VELTRVLFSNGDTVDFYSENQDSLSLQVAEYSRTHGHCTIQEMKEVEQYQEGGETWPTR
jgi:hypothetical protein